MALVRAISVNYGRHGDYTSLMSKTDVSLLAELAAGLRNERTSTTSLLQKCILLGGQVGSERLRDWARQELKGYRDADAVPEYRRVVAPLCIDGATFGGYVTGQQISSMSLPEFARDRVTEDLDPDQRARPAGRPQPQAR